LLKDLILSIQSYFKAHQFIVKHKLWKWILIPGLLYCLLFIGSMILFYNTSASFIEWMSLKTGLKTWIDKMQNTWLGILFIFGGMLLLLLQMLLYFSLFKFIFLIVGSPIFAYLSEKTEAILMGKDFPFSFSQLLKDIIRGIRIALRNTVWQTVYMLTILLLGLVPIIGWVTPLLALLIECYYYGFSMLDYSMERHKKNTSESIVFIGSRKGLAIGNGIGFYFLHVLPIIGWVVAPAYAVVAATLSLSKNFKGQDL
jgi:CysZ protein